MFVVNNYPKTEAVSGSVFLKLCAAGELQVCCGNHREGGADPGCSPEGASKSPRSRSAHFTLLAPSPGWQVDPLLASTAAATALVAGIACHLASSNHVIVRRERGKAPAFRAEEDLISSSAIPHLGTQFWLHLHPPPPTSLHLLQRHTALSLRERRTVTAHLREEPVQCPPA